MIIGIVEDHKDEQIFLQQMIESWTKQEGMNIDIQCFDSGEEFVEAYQKDKYCLVFMDIYMHEMSGIDVVKMIRKDDQDLLFVFLTTSQEHIFEATPLHIFDYIQKPYSQERLIYVLNEMKKCLPYLDKSIEFDCGKQHVVLRLSHIMYIHADNNFTIFKMKHNKEKYRIPFSRIVDMIDDERFVFCIRGIMINMEYILKQEDNYFVMEDMERIYIRRNERKEIIQKYENYQFKKLDSL